MNTFIISNKNNNVLIVASNSSYELCDHIALVLCGHMTQLPLTPEGAGHGIEQAQLWVI